MNDMVIAPGFAAPSAKLAQFQAQPNDLGAGIGQSFGVLSYRGKVFRIKKSGIETPLMRGDGSGPMSQLEVVIIKASPVIAKIYYQGGYTEGDKAPPDCWSVNGVNPDPAAPKKQSATCAGCPMNAWGSRISEAGKAGKACSDSKRLVIVPAADMRNEAAGGPMLLRIPAASLQGISQFAAALQAQGFPYFAVVAQLSFDIAEAFPLLMFKALRPLTDAELDIVLELQSDPRTTRILSEAVDHVVAEVPQPAQVTPAPVVQQPVVVTPPPVVHAPVAATPVAPNPFANAPAPVTPAPVIVQPVAQPVAPPVVVAATPAPAVNPFAAGAVAQPVAQPIEVVQPVVAEADPMVRLAGESAEQHLARLQEFMKGTKARKPRTPKTAAPSPAATAPVTEVVAPVAVAPTPVAVPAAQPVLDQGSLAQLDSLLDTLV